MGFTAFMSMPRRVLVSRPLQYASVIRVASPPAGQVMEPRQSTPTSANLSAYFSECVFPLSALVLRQLVRVKRSGQDITVLCRVGPGTHRNPYFHHSHLCKDGSQGNFAGGTLEPLLHPLFLFGGGTRLARFIPLWESLGNTGA